MTAIFERWNTGASDEAHMVWRANNAVPDAAIDLLILVDSSCKQACASSTNRDGAGFKQSSGKADYEHALGDNNCSAGPQPEAWGGCPDCRHPYQHDHECDPIPSCSEERLCECEGLCQTVIMMRLASSYGLAHAWTITRPVVSSLHAVLGYV